MKKKKLKKLLRKVSKNFNPDMGNSFSKKDGYGFFNGYNGRGLFRNGLLCNLGLAPNRGLARKLGKWKTEQFLIGALLGGAAAYVLADEQLRNKVMKSIMKLYAGMTGGMEEFKEQIADLKAEIQSERGDK